MKHDLFINTLIINFFLSLITGCIDPYEAKVIQGETRLVVEGHITSSEGPYSVILSYSGKYSSKVDGISEFIADASLCIYDDEGNCADLFETSDPGRYYTYNESFRGQIGKSYHLEIILPNGKHYASRPEIMQKPPEIKYTYYDYYPGSNLKREGFYVYIDTEDPGDETNYYKWNTISWDLYSWDPCWNRVPDFSPFNIEADKNIDGNFVASKLVKIVPYNSRLPYVVTVHQQALSENAYEFLKSLNDQINLSGSIFDPPPTFIWGNIRNIEDPEELVLGYFYAAGVAESEIAIDRSLPKIAPKYYATVLPIPLYCGDPCDYLCVAFGGGQCGFPPCPPECDRLPNVTYKPPASWPLNEIICDE
jgi:hypothetical protein